MAIPPEPMKHGDIPETSRIRNYRFLTLQGGGMKGIGYVGAIEELESTGVLTQIEGVAGSSAGAIVAALLAVGYTAKEIREVMMNLDFRDLQDKDSPGWIESTGLKDILKGGVALAQEHDRYDLLNKIPLIKRAAALPGQVVGGLEAAEEIGGLAMGSELGLWSGQALLNIVSAMIARKTGKPNITFKELEALAQTNPGVFRSLTLTGSNLTTKSLEYYNAKDWPDMPIMDAVRISASFPGAFKPVSKPIVKRVHEDGSIETSSGVRVDGGLLENLPDVFNKPPYFDPAGEQQANPEVLALTFKETSKPQALKTGFDLARTLYSTVMSEEALRRKYADNIIFVDPKGVGTLDFDADKSRTTPLANSGGEATQACFKSILALEEHEKQHYEALSLTELIRKEVALKRIIKNRGKEYHLKPGGRDLSDDLIAIQDLILKKTGHYSSKQISQMRLREESRFQAIEAGSTGGMVSNRDLRQSCQRKIDELDNIEKEFELRLKQINLVRVGLELRAAELGSLFQDENSGVNHFKTQLKTLDTLQKKIRDCIGKIASLEIGSTDEELEAQYRKLVAEKNDFFDKTISQYRESNETLLLHYFEELRQDSEDIRFNIPRTQEEIEQRLRKESAKCDSFIKECVNNLEKTKSEKQLFQARLQHFKNRDISAKEYGTLAELQTELNKRIQQKTTTLGKVLDYCVSEQPSQKKNVVTFLVQALSFLAFVARIGVSVGTFFPAAIYLVAKLTKQYSKNPKAIATASRVVRAFHMPNLFKLNKLRELSGMTAHLLEILNKNYNANLDKTEQTYLYGLFSHYLESSGLLFKDIFPKQSEETEKEYLKRIKLFQNKLKTAKPSERVISGLPSSFSKNMNRLRTAVMQDLNRSKKSTPEDEDPLFKKELTFRRNTDLINLRYLKDMNQKLKGDKPLTPTELFEYIKSAIAIRIKIPDKIQQLFLDNIKDKLSSKTRLTKEEFVAYLELEQYHPAEKITNIRTELSKDKEYQEWLKEYELPKSKDEIEQAWNTFFEFARRQSGSNGSPKAQEFRRESKEQADKPKPATRRKPPSPSTSK